MAEGILKDLIIDEVARNGAAPAIDVLSAGTHAQEGQPASPNAVEAAAGHGITLRFHRSRQLTPYMVRRAGLVLAMDQRHVEQIRGICPEAVNVFELKRYGRDRLPEGMTTGIADPYGGSLEEYRAVFDVLNEEVGRVAGILFPMVAGGNPPSGRDS